MNKRISYLNDGYENIPFYKKYALSLVLALLWISNWVGYGISIWVEPGNFSWRYFWEGSLENSTSEFLQLFTFVLLSAHMIHRGSPQSKEGSERLERKVNYLIDAVTAMSSTKTGDKYTITQEGIKKTPAISVPSMGGSLLTSDPRSPGD